MSCEEEIRDAEERARDLQWAGDAVIRHEREAREAAEERATQAEGRIEAFKTTLERIARESSTTNAWWLGRLAREALSPSTEALPTPSEEK